MSEVVNSELFCSLDVQMFYRPSENFKTLFTTDLEDKYLHAISRKLIWVMSR